MMLTVLCLFFLLSTVAHGTGPQFRKFSSSDGSSCVLFEQMDKERGLTFLTACYCKNAEKEKYVCQYDGPVEDCAAYKSDPGEFHAAVIKTLAISDNPCDVTSIEVELCSGLVLHQYNRQES